MGHTPWSEELSAAGVRVHSVGYFGRRYPVPTLRPIELWRLIGSADIVHVTGYWYLLAAAVCFLTRLARVPLVICPAGELLAFDRSQWLKKLYHQLVGRQALASAALIIAVTALERDDLIERFDVKSLRIIVCPNGITPPPAIEDDQLALRLPSFALFVGRLATVKGPDLLVEAFAKVSGAFPDVDLVMIGPDFGMRATLEARVHGLGLAERIRFLGFIDENRRQYFYKHALLLVVPSRSEVMSIVALEAAAEGTPVLLTKSCGFDQVAEIGGGLVVAADKNAIAKGLMTMLSDRAELRQMGQRLRQFVLENYSWSVVARSLLEHLAKVVQSHRLA
jgi:glycosyltransferase involved in cell wall biosynthesis